MPKGGCSRTPQQEERSLSSDMVEKQPGKKVSSFLPHHAAWASSGPGGGALGLSLSLVPLQWATFVPGDPLRAAVEELLWSGWLWRTRLAFLRMCLLFGGRSGALTTRSVDRNRCLSEPQFGPTVCPSGPWVPAIQLLADRI